MDEKEKPNFPIVVTLEDPVKLKGGVFTELKFRKMKGKDALVAEGEKNELRAGWLLYAALADVDVEVFEEISIDDMDTIVEKTVACMGKSAAAEMAKIKAEMAQKDDNNTDGET